MGRTEMRIRIIGGCGSGKSYIARELARIYGVPCYETDNFVWDRSGENTRNSPEVRDAQLAETVAAESWIIEGVHHKWGIESFREADLIFLIKPNSYAQDARVIRRFIKTRLGLEQGNYKQSFKNLYVMLFEWNRGFHKESIPAIMELTEAYKAKRIIVHNNREILQHVSRHLREASLPDAGNRNH
jgi:adenylate kinase family enzyme